MKRFIGTVLLAGMLAAACGSAPRNGPPRSRNVITAEEIAPLNVSTAWDIVQRLRPDYLRSRGSTSITRPSAQYAVVYVNGVRAGGLEQLRSIRAGDVETIRYISASDATTRWGTDHSGGVIEVTTKS
jgi:hypothetical protein